MDYSQRGVIYIIKSLARVPALPAAINGAPVREARPWPTIYIWALILAVVLLNALRLEFANIANTLPYPHHVDEPAIARAGERVITTGSLRPESFNYPALPKYLAAAGLAVGVIRAARNAEILTVELIGNVGYPYYDTRLPMQTARQLFALLSALALVMTAVCAWHAFRRPAIVLLAPLVALVTPLYFYHSWVYLNVDIVGTCFVMMTLAACFAATWQPSMVNSAVVPGLCAGLATGSKYTLGVAILPVLLGVWLFVPARRIAGTVAATAALVAAFLLVAPYSVLDLPTFVNDVAYEGFHYATHHPGFEDRPGLAQLSYYAAHLIADFGIAGVCLAVVGVFVAIRADARRAAMLLAFPVVSLGLLIQERVHFTRNVLAFHPILAAFIGLGLLAVHESVGHWMSLSRWSGLARQQFVQWTVAAGLLLLAVPPAHVIELLRDRTDSRVAATAWLASRVSSAWTVVVPQQLGFSIRELQSSGLKVKVVDLQHARTRAAVDDLIVDVSSPSLVLVPRWGSDPNFPGAQEAVMLNHLASRWRAIKTFGTQLVQVNHPNPAPDGDPAFFVAALNVPDAGITWLENFDNPRRRRERASQRGGGK